jgi:hypothetical protein
MAITLRRRPRLDTSRPRLFTGAPAPTTDLAGLGHAITDQPTTDLAITAVATMAVVGGGNYCGLRPVFIGPACG